jgi:hypothetical protein
MWPWRSVDIDVDGVLVGTERFAFAELSDASLEGSTLVLATTSKGEWRGRVRHGYALLDKILDGIRAAHPQEWFTCRVSIDTSAEPHREHHLRRRVAQSGSPDLWIGRTLYH